MGSVFPYLLLLKFVDLLLGVQNASQQQLHNSGVINDSGGTPWGRSRPRLLYCHLCTGCQAAYFPCQLGQNFTPGSVLTLHDMVDSLASIDISGVHAVPYHIVV